MKTQKYINFSIVVILVALISCNSTTEVENSILKVRGHVYDANDNNPFGDVPIIAFTTCDTLKKVNTNSNSSSGAYLIEINMNNCVGDFHSMFRAPNYEEYHLVIEDVKGGGEYTRDVYLAD
jgi:hypothetical protein